MSTGNSPTRQAQLDKEERENLEDVVTDLRDIVEEEIEYELEHQYDLTTRDGGDGLSDAEQATRERLVEAIDHEDPGDKSWEWCYEQYVTGVGYTIVNRLAAFRTMEVRGFLNRPVTQIGDSGLTPAAERVLGERFDVGRNEALIVAYREECKRMEEEIEILFNLDSPYSVIEPEPDLFRDVVEKLDDTPEEVWRADDVLGWVYEYYNATKLPEVRKKARNEGLDTEDVPVANQFYTPHWVVRMLTDNSLGKLYLESKNKLVETIESQEKKFSADERKNRLPIAEESPEIEDLCTYIVPTDEEGESTDFDDPKEIRVIDPACGSGHFLLYAFDVLERIWWEERPGLDRTEIPMKILEHNLYGVDLDLRACQLAAFNLYLKARSRAEKEGLEEFEMPQVGIVCADSRIAEIEDVTEVFDEVASDQPGVREALESLLNVFEDVHGLGSLLDVKGSLSAEFMEGQTTLSDDWNGDSSLSSFLQALREEVDSQRDSDSFLAQDLKSFLRLLVILSRDYDVALMNPPYGETKRMPGSVAEYVKDNYEYAPEFSVNFIEVCRTLNKNNGRIGMLVKWELLFKQMYEEFRDDFIGGQGSFDFVAEYGYGILDNAMVGTIGSVLRSSAENNTEGSFIRLHDVEKKKKEQTFLKSSFGVSESAIDRYFSVPLDEFRKIPGNPIIYSIPNKLRELHETPTKIDAEVADIDGESSADVVTGLQTGNNKRFVRYCWETSSQDGYFPYSKGGSEAWIIPQLNLMLDWGSDGKEIKRIKGSRPQNTEFYFQSGLTWTYIKRTGRRFGYLPSGCVFDVGGSMLFPKNNNATWSYMSILNSTLYHGLFLSITPERQWNQSDVGKLPWFEQLEKNDELGKIAKRQYEITLNKNCTDVNSPYYIGPALAPSSAFDECFYDNSLSDTLVEDFEINIRTGEKSDTISELAREHKKQQLTYASKLEELSEYTDQIIHEELSISDNTADKILQEIWLRTTESPEDREVSNPGSVPEIPKDLEREVKLLVHHFVMEVVERTAGGVIPMHDIPDAEPSVLDRVVERFHEVYDEYAEARLAEVDEILGGNAAEEEAYPNLRDWLSNDLFEFHIETMENTPVIWKLTTERLVADSVDEGFACLVDYHQLDAGVFDRLSSQCLEPRKVELSERQSAADRRRNDDSLSTSERADAVETYEYCTSALQQIAELENTIQELGGINERDFDTDDRKEVRELAPKVEAFREETANRINTLEILRQQNGAEWFQDTFSNNFWNSINEWRDEWLDSLEELEHACEEYANPSDEPVEAHLADLFGYFTRRLKGSDHYSSSGILFMTYYFEREGADLLGEDGKPFENLSSDEQKLASLAMGLDDPSVLEVDYLEEVTDDDQDIADIQPLAEYKALAEEIDDRCQTIEERTQKEWKDRALSEITTAGYQPNHKHGVSINITPLAEHDLVPRIVDDKVI